MSWVCSVCSSNNEDSSKKCAVCECERSDETKLKWETPISDDESDPAAVKDPADDNFSHRKGGRPTGGDDSSDYGKASSTARDSCFSNAMFFICMLIALASIVFLFVVRFTYVVLTGVFLGLLFVTLFVELLSDRYVRKYVNKLLLIPTMLILIACYILSFVLPSGYLWIIMVIDGILVIVELQRFGACLDEVEGSRVLLWFMFPVVTIMSLISAIIL